MRTIVTDSVDVAAAFIRSGATAAFPTETVYGLGADTFDEAAVRLIFDAKGRPEDNPLIVHLADRADIDSVVDFRSAEADLLVERFMPGPLTIILKKNRRIPDIVTAGLDTVGIRVPLHPVAQAFLASTGPVAAPSANRSGRPSPTTWQAVLEDLDGRIPCILKGGRSAVGLESTVVDCTASPPVVFRAGAVSLEELRKAIPEIMPAGSAVDGPARSPGTRHRHYAPRSEVLVVATPISPPTNAAFIGIEEPPDGFKLVRVCASVDEYAHELFDFFRRCDAAGITTIVCQTVGERGIGSALMDRIRRAAEA